MDTFNKIVGTLSDLPIKKQVFEGLNFDFDYDPPRSMPSLISSDLLGL